MRADVKISSWVVEGFNNTFTASFNVFEKMIMSKFFFKVMKKGTINTNATFTFTLLDGSAVLFTETITATQVNAVSTDNYYSNFNISCPGIILNTNADGTAKGYTWSFSSANYTPTTNSDGNATDNSFGICKRQRDDEQIRLSNDYTVTDQREQAQQTPLFIEYEVLV